MPKAPRPPLHFLQALVRGAALAAALVAVSPAASLAQSQIKSAKFSEPTTRYAHGVLGDDIEYGALEIRVENNGAEVLKKVTLPLNRVFEDIKPRLIDLTGDGALEVVVVESQADTGAQLSVYDAKGQKLAATPHIGQANRWLAPIGAADFDGDGHIEIAYIDRPHLAKTLRLWRFKNGQLRQVAALEGLTNHKIGWDFIASGVRDCGNGPEMITADARWQHIMATRFDGKTIAARRVGPYRGPDSINQALSCPK